MYVMRFSYFFFELSGLDWFGLVWRMKRLGVAGATFFFFLCCNIDGSFCWCTFQAVPVVNSLTGVLLSMQLLRLNFSEDTESPTARWCKHCQVQRIGKGDCDGLIEVQIFWWNFWWKSHERLQHCSWQSHRARITAAPASAVSERWIITACGWTIAAYRWWRVWTREAFTICRWLSATMFCPERHRSLVQFVTKRLLGGFCREIFRHWSQQPEALPALSDLHELALSGCSPCESLSALRYLPIKESKQRKRWYTGVKNLKS